MMPGYYDSAWQMSKKYQRSTFRGGEKMWQRQLIDWYDFAKTHSELFYEDGTHPNFHGAAVYAQLIAKHVAERGVVRDNIHVPEETESAGEETVD